MTEQAARYDTGQGYWAFLRMERDLKPRLRWVYPGHVLWIHVAIPKLAMPCYRSEVSGPYPMGRWVKAAAVPWERMKPGFDWSQLYILDEIYKNRVSGKGPVKKTPKIEPRAKPDGDF